MRVVIINPWLRTVTEKNINPNSLQDIYENLTHEGQKMTDDFNIVGLAPKVALYVDGEGFLKTDVPVFKIIGHGRPDQLRPLAGIGILFGGADPEGNALPMPEYISLKFCEQAVTWTKLFSTGMLEPTTQEGNTITIGEPILREEEDAEG